MHSYLTLSFIFVVVGNGNNTTYLEFKFVAKAMIDVARG